MVIGGIAIIGRGVRRMTTDIDAVVRGDRIDPKSLLRLLAGKRIVPRIEDVEAFARESLVLLLRHDPTGVALDVSLAWTAFEHDAIEACTDAKFGAITAPMARAEDLWSSRRWRRDRRTSKTPRPFCWCTRTSTSTACGCDLVRLGELAAMADEPALVAGLEQVIRRSTTMTARTTGAPVAPPRKAKPRSQRSAAKPSNKAVRHKRTRS